MERYLFSYHIRNLLISFLMMKSIKTYWCIYLVIFDLKTFKSAWILFLGQISSMLKKIDSRVELDHPCDQQYLLILCHSQYELSALKEFFQFLGLWSLMYLYDRMLMRVKLHDFCYMILLNQSLLLHLKVFIFFYFTLETNYLGFSSSRHQTQLFFMS